MMSLPSGFGEFFPDGDFEDGDNPDAIGWGGRLKAFMRDLPEGQQNELMPAGNPGRYSYFVSRKFTSEVGTMVAPDLPAISPLLEHEAPKSFDTAKACKNLGDLIMLNSRILAVSEGLKAAIEDLDKDAHQFFEIDIAHRRYEQEKKYFTIKIGNYRDSIDSEASKLPALPPGKKYKFTKVTKSGAGNFKFSSSRFVGANLWRERKFNEFIVLFSDELALRIQSAGLTTPKLIQAKEIT